MTNTVELGVIGVSNVTVTTFPINGDKGGFDPTAVLRGATRRYSSQGAREVSLHPKRGGQGWKVTKGTAK